MLLVDDEPAFQRLGGAFLRGLGHAVTLAGDGEQALAPSSARGPTLVLLDLAMPPHMDPAGRPGADPALSPACPSSC